MTPESVYFLKVNIAIALFYIFYRLFFKKDTFFRWRRGTLLCLFLISLSYPFLNLQEWIKTQESIIQAANLYILMGLPTQIFKSGTMPTENIPPFLSYIIHIYWIGVIILFARLLLQFICIIRLHFQCRTKIIQDIQVHLLNQAKGPFSFFQWIFIHPSSHTEDELNKILTHERGHVSQKHSIDIIVSELICIACWFNPFAWLIKQEVRGNLEYMADNYVLEKGHGYKSYQYYLLRLAQRNAGTSLSNNFNALSLQSRIQMMNKRRSKEIEKAKYLLLLPFTLSLIIISNIEMMTRTIKEITGEITEESVFETVEQMPEFPGGATALLNYLAHNIKYPREAQENGDQGRVIIEMCIDREGQVDKVKVVKGICPTLDNEALRVVKNMPKWNPGLQRGKKVAVKYTVPISFRLEPSPPENRANQTPATSLS